MIVVGATTFFFAPADDVRGEILSFAQAEKTELCVGAYAFTLEPLVEALLANHQAGIVQYVLADLSQSRGHPDHAALVEVINAGIDTTIGTAPSGNILHSKYLLGKGQAAVFSGSYNFSASAAVQDNCSQRFADATVWTAFRSHFDAARSWVIANEPQDQIKGAVVAGTPLEALHLKVPVRFEAVET